MEPPYHFPWCNTRCSVVYGHRLGDGPPAPPHAHDEELKTECIQCVETSPKENSNAAHIRG